LFAGVCAHQTLPLEHPFTAPYGLVLLAAGHAGGWPFVAGGTERMAEALCSLVKELGGRVLTGDRVASLREVEDADAVVFDTTPRAAAAIAGDALPQAYRRRLRAFERGPAVFKVDYALETPIPWTAPECRGAGTVHVGGTSAEIAAAKREVANGRAPEHPFVIVGQESVADPSRVPAGAHTVWAYCQVPNACPVDMTGRIEDQIERFAPGFRSRIRHRFAASPGELEARNVNLAGGDIAGGALDGFQIFMRPSISLQPHRTPNPRLFLCSASTPPGGGVHGMGGYWAAMAALRGGVPAVLG
jgi:phytoene dehydrogenase-like protein